MFILPNLLEVLEESGNFSLFLKACEEGGLDDMLTKEGDFTIFAPPDYAFDLLPAIEKKALFESPPKLTNLILNHCIEWGVTSNEISQTKKLRTLGDDLVDIKVKKKSIKINDNAIIEQDIEADNGFIHIIEKVLIPPGIWDLE